MRTPSTALILGAFVVGLVVGGGVIYAVTRPAPSAGTDGGVDTGFDPRGAGFGGGGATMNFRGDYDSGVGYLTGDVVTFKGSAYVAGDETKDQPPEGAWAVLVDAGEGPEGPQGLPGPKGDKGDAGPSGAAGGISGYEIRTTSELIGAQVTKYILVSCSSGKQALGGGYIAETGLTVQADHPIGQGTDIPTAWQVWVSNTSGGSRELRAQVICANAP
jgi:hypothetical protein